MANVKIRPTCGRLLLHVLAPAERNIGGVIAPAREVCGAHREAYVQALPNGYVGGLVPGDRVLVPPYIGVESKINGERLVFVAEKDILAVLE